MNQAHLERLRSIVSERVAGRLGDEIICGRCGATYKTYGERCAAALDERCDGFNRVDVVQMSVEKEVGLTR